MMLAIKRIAVGYVEVVGIELLLLTMKLTDRYSVGRGGPRPN